jgi:hypothetical protein
VTEPISYALKQQYIVAKNILIRLEVKGISERTVFSKVLIAVQSMLGNQVSGSPDHVLRLFITQHTSTTATTRPATTSPRAYTLDRAMTRSMLRCKEHPVQIGIN